MNKEEIEALSINSEINRIDLAANSADRIAAVVRGLSGLVPVAGSLIQEAINVAIPNQRMDRIALTLEVFGQKLKGVEDDLLKQKIRSEEFADLLEDAIPQAAKSMSDERRDYIASLLANSITKEDLDHVHEKKLFSILGELNDAEILVLRYESLRQPKQNEFFEQHKEVLSPVAAPIGAPRSEHDKRAFRRSYQDKLFDLGLMAKEYADVKKGEIPEFDKNTGMQKAKWSKLTQLGRVFLRYIDQPSEQDQAQDAFYASKQQKDSPGR